MKFKKKTLIPIIALAGVTATLAGAAMALSGNVVKSYAETPRVVGVSFEENYTYGDTLNLPAGASIAYNGSNVPVKDSYLIYPDGSIFSGENFELDAYGKYTVVYEGTVDGKEVKAENEFFVKKDYYSLTSSASEIGYGPLNGSFVNSGYNNGLKLSLAEGETFSYAKPLNIYENEYTSLISFNCMQMETAVKYITLRLTDCYDPSIYMDIVYKRDAYAYQTYILAGAYGMKSVGLVSDSSGPVEVDGENYRVDQYGTMVPGNQILNNTYNNITISLDTSDQKGIKVYATTDAEVKHFLVSELNHERAYSYQFEGFTNGNVYLSITAANLVNIKQAPIEIGQIMGQSGKELAPIGYYEDDTAPIFKTEMEKDAADVMIGVPVRVPSVKAMDDSGICGACDYTVWYGYKSSAKKMIAVKDGVFIPNQIGIYTIEYTATDVYGNVGKKTIDLYACDKGEEGISFECDEYSEVFGGERISFGNYRITKYLNEMPTVTIALRKPSGVCINVSAEGDVLIDACGEYTVVYEYADSLYNGSYSYTFTAKDKGEPVFMDKGITIPNYFVKNAVYSIEKATALYYPNDGNMREENVLCYVRYDGGEYTLCDRKAITVSGNDTMQIKFVCENNPSVYMESKVAEIVDVGYGTQEYHIEKYFVGDFNTSINEQYASYQATKAGEAALDFINTLSYASFAVSFENPNGNFEGVDIYLTDYYDNTKSLKLTVSGNTYAVNDGRVREIYETENKYSLEFSNGVLYLNNNSILAEIPFTTDYFTLRFVGKGGDVNAELRVYSLCRHSFFKDASNYYDEIRPIVNVEFPEKVGHIGGSATVKKPFALDVLSPVTEDNCKVSVYKNGVIMSATDGTVLNKISDFEKEYIIYFDEYGTYLVVYEVTDGVGNKTTIRQSINVADVIAPTITLENYNGSTQAVSVGPEISPLKYTLQDNISSAEELEVWIVVYSEKGEYIGASQGTYTLKNAGEYKIYLYCSDAEGNTAYVCYNVRAN